MTIETAGSTPAQPVSPAAPAKNVFQRIAGVFFAPDETFADIARRPDILWPLVILTLFSFVTTALIVPRLDMDAVVAQQAEMLQKQNPNMSDADVERMGRMTRAMGKVSGWLTPVLSIIGYLLIALVLWGAFRVMGGDGDFKESLSTTLYAYMPAVLLGGLIATVIIVMRGTVDPTQMATVVKTNPAFLVDAKEQPVLSAFLASFNIFVLWTIFLLTVGFSKVARVTKAKAATIIVLLWLVTIGVKVGFAALGAARMNG
ncbi:MAG TPA: Yip1 family protein [Thermoanaerobaculia bacterium]|nr:Yip1 family protein [Thermoanaerobaculia bacterium]